MGDSPGSKPGARVGTAVGPLPDVRYYKSDRRPLPIIFEQKKRLWRSYAPGGVLLISKPGRIPPEMLETLEEIDEVEAKRWLSGDVWEVTRAPGVVVVEKTDPAPPVLVEPRRWREFVLGPALIFVVIWVAFAGWRIVNALRYPDLVWPHEVLYGLFLLAVVLLAALLSLFRRRASVHALGLSGAEITGRSGLWRRRWTDIPLDDLDRVRSAKRNLVAHILGWQYLYSRKGRRIVFVRRYFDGETVRGLLDQLGIPQ
jgi:hypothetical protein